MNSYDLIFQLNATTRITAQLKDPLSYVGYRDAEPIFLLYNNDYIMLADGPIYFNIRDLRDMLKKALSNQLTLHESIKSNIGYLCNGYYHNNLGFITESSNSGTRSWVGYRYYLWETYDNEKKYVTWLYNNHNNDIILEITPSYPYRYCDIKKQRHYITFKKWMLQYRPYLTTILPKETAQEWLAVAEHFVKSVDDNIEHWKKEAQNT